MNPTDGSVLEGGDYVYLRKDFNCVYPMGMDTVWFLSGNRLGFVNNIKMKISVIMGVLHMSIGVIIKGTNAIHFGKMDDFLSEVVAGLIILLALFGWMDALIIGKWLYPVDIEDKTITPENRYAGDVANENVPSVINIMIV